MSREINVLVGDREVGIYNPNEYDMGWPLWLMSAGAYGDTKLLVWAMGVEGALENFMDWLDDNAPGCLTWVDYQGAMDELGYNGDLDELTDDQQAEVVEHAETDLTLVSHTTLKNGDAIPSHEWWVDDVDGDTYTAAVDACKPLWGFGGGQRGCLYDHYDDGYATRGDAVAAATSTYELTLEEHTVLREEGQVRFDGDRATEVGCEYVELYEQEATEYIPEK